MRVLLAGPRINSKMVGYSQMVRSKLLALEYIADALLQDGHDFSLVDMRVDPQDVTDARVYLQGVQEPA